MVHTLALQLVSQVAKTTEELGNRHLSTRRRDLALLHFWLISHTPHAKKLIYELLRRKKKHFQLFSKAWKDTKMSSFCYNRNEKLVLN